MTFMLVAVLLILIASITMAKCPEVGTASQDETIEEAADNLQEARELYLGKVPLEEILSPHPYDVLGRIECWATQVTTSPLFFVAVTGDYGRIDTK